MLNSLRFRLPALFLAGIALAGLVTSLIALRLFQDFTRNESLQELRQEARGLADLYAEWAVRALDEDKAAPTFAASKLEAATGDRLFEVVLAPSFLDDFDQDSGLTRLSRADVGVDLSTDRIVTFEFEPPGEDRSYLAAAYPIQLGGQKGVTFSILIVAKPKAELRRDLDHPALASRDRVSRRPRHRRRARALPLAPDHEAGPGALEGDGPGRGGTP